MRRYTLENDMTLSEAGVGIVIFILIPAIVRVALHKHLRRGLAGNLVSALISAFVIQILSYISLGYLDPFFMPAFVVSVFVALIISSVVEGFMINRGRTTP